MNIMNNIVAYFLTEEEVRKIKLYQRALHLEPNLGDVEAKEMWHLLYEEPDYAGEILDGYEKLIRDRRIQQFINRLPEKERYTMERELHTIPDWADEIINYWENRARNDDDDWDDNNRDDDGDGLEGVVWEEVSWDDDDDY